MLENLSSRLSRIVKTMRGQARLTEQNTRDMLREVRLALLEADVALPVVRELTARIKEKALGEEVVGNLNPGQALVGVVERELTAVIGGDVPEKERQINLSVQPPAVILLAGLQGSGKTTSAAKIAKWLKENLKKKVLTVSADVYRPAAIDQLKTVSAQAGADFFESTPDQKPLDIARLALDHAKRHFYDVLIVDTAGRLAIDEAMMQEVSDLADKLDGDSRGGAALSVRMVTGKPIKFVGLGEKLDGFELFNPEQMAGRILGMGDIVSLVKDVQKSVDQKTVEKLAKKIKSGDKFDLEDFKGQISQMKNMGPISGIIEKLPAQFQQAAAHVNDKDAAKQIRRTEGIINSMTPKERRNPEIIKASRKRRIAAGAGVTVQEVNRLLKQFEQTRDVMKHMQKGGMAKMMRALGQLGGRFGGFGRR